ncbi:hypothetical protein [Roseateles sp. LKC17W]|uniref:Uncharacterized protein n=1 Tax=Pelomonas margarita TaxID=3299031 RepID=A0ABW7FFX1_9BURK
MTFHDCLCEATRAAIDADVPAWLLPATIVNQAALLGGARLDGDDVMSRA